MSGRALGTAAYLDSPSNSDQVLITATVQSEETGAFDDRGTDRRPAKRNRVMIACTCCRQRKSRCDGARPKCSACANHGYECTYASNTTLTKSSASTQYLEGLESRLTVLEQSLTGVTSRLSRIESSEANETTNKQQGTHNAHVLEPRNEEGTTIDTHDPTDGIGSISFTKEEESGFFGPSSNIAFTRQIVRSTTEVLKSVSTAASPVSPSTAALQSHVLHVSRPPSPLERHFSLDTASLSAGTEPFVLPPKAETTEMMERYFSTTGELFPYIDKEAFLQQYDQLTSANIRTVRRSWLGLLNMVLAMSTSASYDSDSSATERAATSDVFFRRTLALCEKQIRHGTSLEVVQLLLLMSQYLQGTERSIETWNIHGLAVKAAYQLGLHSSDAMKKFPIIEGEFRKRTWFGCVVLDRTLSMTLGRPSSIPDSFVKLDLPCSLSRILAEGTDLGRNGRDEYNAAFFTATISLYRIMGEVIEILYGNNLGCNAHENLFDTASALLQFEQKYMSWQRSLPAFLSLVEPETLHSEEIGHASLRFRLILTLRFLNLRILTHRPLLSKYLECIGNSHTVIEQLAILKQLGANSLRICVHSAISIIKLVRGVLAPPEPSCHLLGAWWFSLYYTFNASLVIYSALLIHHQMRMREHPLELEQAGLSMDSLNQAIGCLSLLYKAGRMTEKCVKYITALAKTLSIIYVTESSLETETNRVTSNASTNSSIRPAPISIGCDEISDFFDSTDLHMGMSLDDLLCTSDFNIMSSH